MAKLKFKAADGNIYSTHDLLRDKIGDNNLAVKLPSGNVGYLPTELVKNGSIESDGFIYIYIDKATSKVIKVGGVDKKLPNSNCTILKIDPYSDDYTYIPAGTYSTGIDKKFFPSRNPREYINNYVENKHTDFLDYIRGKFGTADPIGYPIGAYSVVALAYDKPSMLQKDGAYIKRNRWYEGDTTSDYLSYHPAFANTNDSFFNGARYFTVGLYHTERYNHGLPVSNQPINNVPTNEGTKNIWTDRLITRDDVYIMTTAGSHDNYKPVLHILQSWFDQSDQTPGQFAIKLNALSYAKASYTNTSYTVYMPLKDLHCNHDINGYYDSQWYDIVLNGPLLITKDFNSGPPISSVEAPTVT